MNVIKKTISLEPYKTRLPIALPFIDEDGVVKEYVDNFINYSWGKIMPNIVIPTDWEGIEVDLNGYKIEAGKTYYYRYGIDLYYEIIKSKGRDLTAYPYLGFIEYILGIVDLQPFIEQHDIIDAPCRIYITQVQHLIDILQSLKDETQILSIEELNKLSRKETIRLDKSREVYRRKGGDLMLNHLKSLPTPSELIERVKPFISYDTFPTIDIDVFIGSTMNDMGVSTLLLNKWVAGKKYYEGDVVYFEGESYICTVENGQYSEGLYSDETGMIEFDHANFVRIKDIDEMISSTSMFGNRLGNENLNLTGKTESKLKSLRTNKKFIDSVGQVIEPKDYNEDFLAYYKVGLSEIECKTDEFGNIEHFGFDYTNGNDLLAYGNGIKSIEYNSDVTELTITYFVNVRLKADFIEARVMEDGVRYIFDNFRYDTTDGDEYSNGGQVIKETYNILVDSDLYKLIKGEIDGLTFENVIDMTKPQPRRTFPFYNLDRLNQGDYTYSSKRDVDYLYGYMIKYDHNLGYSYQEKIQDYTDMTRGETNYFESHIKLSEINTMEDALTYSNGGYFSFENN